MDYPPESLEEPRFGNSDDARQFPSPSDAEYHEELEHPEPHPIRGPSQVVIKNSKQHQATSLETNQQLFTTAARLDNAISELWTYFLIFQNRWEDPTKNNIAHNEKIQGEINEVEDADEILHTVRETILPVLHIAAGTLRDTAHLMAPFPGTKMLHSRNDAERKREVVDAKSSKSPGLQMMQDFVHNSDPCFNMSILNRKLDRLRNKFKAAENDMEGNEKQGEFSNARPPKGDSLLEKIHLPPPRSSSGVYSKLEALRVIKSFRKGKSRGIAVRAMIARGLVLGKRAAIYKLIHNDEKGLPIEDDGWNKVGRPSKRKPPPNETTIRGKDVNSVHVGNESIPVTIVGRDTTQPQEKQSTNPAAHENETANQCASELSTAQNPMSSPAGISLTKEHSLSKYPNSHAEAGSETTTNPSHLGSNATSSSEPQLATSRTPQNPPNAIVPSSKKTPKAKTPKRKSLPTKSSIAKRKSTTPAKPTNKTKKPPINVDVPPPANGTAYTKLEALEIIKQYEKGSFERGAVIKSMREKNYIPNARSTIYQLIKRDERGLPITNDEWNSTGRKSHFTDEEIEYVVRRIENDQSGSKYGIDEVRELLLEVSRAKVEKAGGDVDSVEVKRSTARNYTTIIASRLRYRRGVSQNVHMGMPSLHTI